MFVWQTKSHDNYEMNKCTTSFISTNVWYVFCILFVNYTCYLPPFCESFVPNQQQEYSIDHFWSAEFRFSYKNCKYLGMASIRIQDISAKMRQFVVLLPFWRFNFKYLINRVIFITVTLNSIILTIIYLFIFSSNKTLLYDLLNVHTHTVRIILFNDNISGVFDSRFGA